MFNNLKSSIQQAFFESLEQAGCLQLETEGREEDSDSGSEASDEEWEEGSGRGDGEGGDLENDEEEEEEEDEGDDGSDDEETTPAEASGPDSQRLLPLSAGGGPKMAPGEGGGFIEVNLDSAASPAKTSDPALDAAWHAGAQEQNRGPRPGV